MRVTGPAGMFDQQFGVQSLRQLPPLTVVVLTSGYSASTGYSWSELRCAPGVGFFSPTLPLTGNLAYDITGNQALTAGTICAMAIERDQTTYALWFVVSTGGTGTGTGGTGGTGTGTGGCNESTQVVTFTCENGRRIATTWTLGIGIDGNKLILSQCEEEETDLGACSPDNPDGTTLPVATQVCEAPAGNAVGDVIIKLTADYTPYFLLADGSDVSRTTYADLFDVYGETFGPGDGSTTFTLPTLADPVADLSYYVRAKSPAPIVSRTLVTVPVSDSTGCKQFEPDECCPGGSGTGTEECILTCDQCVTGMSGVWLISVLGYDDFNVYHVQFPDDGNYCRFVSGDLTWELRFDYGTEIWTLENFDTGAFYFTAASDWACMDPNELINIDLSGDNAAATPVNDCSVISYNCVDSSCVAVAGAGGTYATLEECQDACGGGLVTKCGCTVPRTLYAHFTGALASWGTVTLTYSGVFQTWLGSDNGSCGANGDMAFDCNPTNSKWTLANVGPNTSFNTGETNLLSCSPFVFVAAGIATGTCSGAYTVTVDANP